MVSENVVFCVIGDYLIETLGLIVLDRQILIFTAK